MLLTYLFGDQLIVMLCNLHSHIFIKTVLDDQEIIISFEVGTTHRYEKSNNQKRLKRAYKKYAFKILNMDERI